MTGVLCQIIMLITLITLMAGDDSIQSVGNRSSTGMSASRWFIHLHTLILELQLNSSSAVTQEESGSVQLVLAGNPRRCKITNGT